MLVDFMEHIDFLSNLAFYQWNPLFLRSKASDSRLSGSQAGQEQWVPLKNGETPVLMKGVEKE